MLLDQTASARALPKAGIVQMWPESINKELQGTYEKAPSFFISKISYEQLYDY